MRLIQLITLLAAIILFNSCSKLFNACVRNLTHTVATVDVILLDITDMKVLPNKIRAANRIINMKKNYNNQMDSTQNVIWLDKKHFQLQVAPQTTVDLSDMVGLFRNGNPRADAVVVIAVNNKTDTLLNGRYNYKSEKFGYTGNVFTPKLNYDVVDSTITPYHLRDNKKA